MASLAENTARAIAVFDNIKAAFAENGITVEAGTPVEEYPDKINDVYSVGYSDGQNESNGGSYDEFWEVIQFNGKRTNYTDLLFGITATGTAGIELELEDFEFIPKYPFTNVTSISRILSNVHGITTVGELIMPNCTTAPFAFYKCYDLENVEAVILPNATYISNIFSYSNKLKRIGRIDISSRTDTGFVFYACTALEEINFEGIIQSSISFQWCPLTKNSIINIFGVLSPTAEGVSVSFSKQAVNTAFETEEGLADGTSSTEWAELIATKSNWTITLV